MSLRDDILDPISGANPAGIDLRRDTKLLIYEKIKEARRQDDDLSQGDWVAERKVADYSLIVRLAQDSIATVSKDLQLAAWLTEALLRTEPFGGLRQGLDLCRRLVSEFWDTLYPVLEDGDREFRATPLSWIGSNLDLPLRSAPLVERARYSLLSYQESRTVGYEDQAKTDKERSTRAKLIEKEKKLAPEVFDKAFAETPKSFYVQAEKDLDGSLLALEALGEVCDEKFEGDAPSFRKLKTAIEEVRRTVHSLLEKKRESDPDSVPAPSPVPTPDHDSDSERHPPIPLQLGVTPDPADHSQALAAVAGAASFLRKQEPLSPAPYLMLRGLRWGELRAGGKLEDATLLEAPPTDLRQNVKRLALAGKWRELLEACEGAMAHPCSRAWLDLQRLSVAACNGLGNEYQPIAIAIQTELRALLNDLPELLDATLLDDTPAANPETKAWLLQLGSSSHLSNGFHGDAQAPSEPAVTGTPVWLSAAADAYSLAKDALTEGHAERAFAIMRVEIARQRSGRNRFRRTMQLIDLAVSSGKDAIAQPLLEDIAAAIENHKLDAWEDPELVAGDLLQLMRHSKRIQGSSSDKQKLFERICRLDPVLALKAE